MSPKKFLGTYSHLCFERRYHKQNSVIRLKSNILSPTNFPPQTFGCLRYCLQEQVAKLASGLFYTVVLYRVIITRQQILRCSLQVTILGVLPHVTLERRHLRR